MTEVRVLLVLGLLAFAGCKNEGLDYAKAHPDLSPEHRHIITSGNIPAGTAVAGLTHDEVKLAMKGFPNTFDRIGGEEAWIYVRKKSVPVGMAVDQQTSPSSRRDMPDPSTAGPIYDVNERTTVFFTGDKATHAEVSQEKP